MTNSSSARLNSEWKKIFSVLERRIKSKVLNDLVIYLSINVPQITNLNDLRLGVARGKTVNCWKSSTKFSVVKMINSSTNIFNCFFSSPNRNTRNGDMKNTSLFIPLLIGFLSVVTLIKGEQILLKNLWYSIDFHRCFSFYYPPFFLC